MRRVLLVIAIVCSLVGQMVVAPDAGAEDGVDRLVRLAVRAQLEGRHDQALALYTQALGEPSIVAHRQAALHTDRGVIYSRLGRTKAALDDFNAAIKLYPENPSVYNNRGSTLLAIGYDREAIKDFNRAILLSPGYAAAYLNRGSAYLALREAGAGLDDYNRAVRLEPDNAVVLSARGVVHLKAARWQAALRDFSKAIASNTRFDDAYSQRAEVLMLIGRPSEAVEDLSRAIVFAPQDAKLYVQRGRAYLQGDDAEAAVRDFSKAIEIREATSDSHSLRGLAQAEAGEYEAALGDLSRALELDQRSAVSYAYRAYVYLKMNQIALAERDVETARKLNAASAEVQWVEGEVAAVEGAQDKAIAFYRKVLAEAPAHRMAEKGLARLNVEKPYVPAVAVGGLGGFGWEVSSRGGRYLAVNPSLADLEVPLEVVGQGAPKILDWQVRPAPHKRYGILRFAAGSVGAGKLASVLESAAIVDVSARRVLAIVPHRAGARKAEWIWGEQKLDVASADGVHDVVELEVRRTAPAVAHFGSGARGRGDTRDGQPSWSPWANAEEPQRRRVRNRPSERKPKTLFDVLFGN